MKKELFYIGVLTTSILFTGCSEESQQTTEKKSVLSASDINERLTDNEITAGVKEQSDRIHSEQETTTEEHTASVNEELSSRTKELTDSTKDQPSSVTDEENQKNVIESHHFTEKSMKIGEPYTIHKGETISKVSLEPKLTIETNLETGETTATLLEGEAKIKKSSFSFF